jgi:hypothetical protein
MLVLDPNNKQVSLPIKADGALIVEGSTTPVPAVPNQVALRVDANGNLIIAP